MPGRGATTPSGTVRTVVTLVAAAFLLHALVWILLPSMLEGSIRLDVAEGAIGGQHWRLVYARHPPFTLWLTEIARLAGPLRYQALYAIAQALALGGLAGAVWGWPIRPPGGPPPSSPRPWGSCRRI